MNAVKKKLILFLGQPEEEISNGIQDTLKREMTSSSVNPQIVWARDGMDATRKIENQKFDAVVIDMQAARLKDSNFLYHVGRHRSTANADLIALVPDDGSALPSDLTRVHQVLKKPYDVQTVVAALAKALAEAQASEAKPAAASSEFAVDVRVLNSILKATVAICQEYGLKPIQLDKPQVKRNTAGQMWSGDIGATIDIKSRMFQGALIVSFEKKPYLKMFETMLGEPQADLNAENSEAIGEIVNMILGNAKSDFTDYDVALTLPKPLKAGEPYAYPAGAASILIKGNSSAGLIFVEVVAIPVKK